MIFHWILAMFHQSDNPTTLLSITGNVLNEWLLIKNTSVDIDWNEPYYTSDEGPTCILFMCNLPSCSFHSSINKSTKNIIFYVNWSFINPSLGDVQQVFVGFVLLCICISDQRMRDFVRSWILQLRVEASRTIPMAQRGREAAHKKCQVNVVFLGEKKRETWTHHQNLQRRLIVM